MLDDVRIEGFLGHFAAKRVGIRDLVEGPSRSRSKPTAKKASDLRNKGMGSKEFAASRSR